MITIGVDFHKRTSMYNVLSPQGEVIKRCRLENSRDTILEFFNSIADPKQVAVEATRSWGLFYDTVNEFVDQFHLGHPQKIKILMNSELKNDQRDAAQIAKLTQVGMLPHAYCSSTEVRQFRSLLRFRHSLVDQRRSIRNQVQTLLDRNLWPNERPNNFKDPFCQRGRTWMQNCSLPEKERLVLDLCLQTFDDLSTKIRQIESHIKQHPVDMTGLALLRTVPGFQSGGINSAVVLGEIADIHRFPKARSLAHYAGLVPREFSSGDKHRTGRLIKSANMHLRTALLESALAAIRKDKGLKAYYKQVKERRGSGPAIVATARKLVYAIYGVLKEQRPYRPEPIRF
jgi:transposase